MPISKKLEKFLEKKKIKCETIQHRTVYTAFDKAQTLKVAQKIIAKTLLVKIDKNPALISIPANKNLDLQKLKKVAKAKKIDFLREAWVKKNLKGVKPGAVPPLGSLFGLPTFIDKSLMGQSKIIVNAGNYNFSIKLSPSNLKKLLPDLKTGNFAKVRK